MKRSLQFVYGIIYLMPLIINAGGVSVDAGLTPGQDRWILRTQYRYIRSENQMMQLQNHTIPLMIAYGVTKNITLMTRLMYVSRVIDQNGRQVKNGLNDPFFLAKFKACRKNTSAYVVGIAPYIATNVPVGNESISQRVWNPELGVNASLRPRFWSFDLNVSYVFTDLSNKSENSIDDQLSLNLAVSSTVPLGSPGVAISPVFELTYNTDIRYKDRAGSKNEILFLSPGLIYIKSSFMIEFLFQYPAYQQESENGMEIEPRFIAGLRYMF